MLESLLQWTTLHKIIINTLFVSIPEEFYWLMFTLILLGEFDYWKEHECKKLINPWDYGRLLIPTITVALLSNIIRYGGLDFGFISFIPIVVMYAAIVLTNDLFRDASAAKWMGKAFVFMMLGYMTIGISEFIYIPLALYITGKTIAEVNNDLLLNFLISLPSRFILYSILLYFIAKRRTMLKGKIIKNIASSSLLSVLTSVIMLFDILCLFLAYKSIVYEKILTGMSHVSQFLIIIAITLFPVLNILGFIWGMYFVENRAVNKQKKAYDKLGNILNEIKTYTYLENYDNIKWKLGQIGMGIEEIAADLYKDAGAAKK